MADMRILTLTFACGHNKHLRIPYQPYHTTNNIFYTSSYLSPENIPSKTTSLPYYTYYTTSN